jgi:hypothetical protein
MPDQMWQAIDTAIAKGDVYKAHLAIERGGVQLTPQGSPDDWRQWLNGLGWLAERWRLEPLKVAAGRAGEQPEDSQAWYRLGYQLLEAELAILAESVLARSLWLKQSPETLAELVAALEWQGRYGEAVAAITTAGLADQDPLCAYLLAFNSAMEQDLGPARARLPALEQVGQEPALTFARQLAGMLGRAEALGERLESHDLPAWHFVWTGGLLLTPTLRTGWATWQDLRIGLAVLEHSLDALGVRFDSLLTPPDRGSRILGEAASALMHKPLSVWRGSEEAGLLMVYDVLALDPVLRQALRTRHPGQTLYVYMADSEHEAPAAGDLTGVFGRSYRPPWKGGVTPQGVSVPPVNDSPEILSSHILDAKLDEAELAARGEFVRLAAMTRPSVISFEQPGKRSRQWVLPHRLQMRK